MKKDFQVTFKGFKNARYFLKHVYEDSNIYLDRKYSIFKNIKFKNIITNE